jgi:hypothetical protein
MPASAVQAQPALMRPLGRALQRKAERIPQRRR